MTTALQRRRGTTTEHSTFTGLEGEITVDTTKDTAVVHDGATVGGHELAKADGSNISWADGVRAKFGASNDLQIWHDGSNSYIKDSGTGDLKLQGNNLTIGNTADTKYFTAVNGGASKVYNAGIEKLSTTSTGISVTGDVDMPDNGKLLLGASDDLQIYHDGGNSYIEDAGTGVLFIRGSSQVKLQGANGENGVDIVENAAVKLYYDGAKKLDTSASGVDITGTVTADDVETGVVNNGVASGTMTVGGGAAQNTGGNVIFYGETHAQTGDILLRSGTKYIGRFTSGGDFRLYDDSAGAAATRLHWDASTERLGVGVANPTSELHVANSGGATGDVRLTLDTGSSSTIGQDAEIFSYRTNAALIFGTGNTERVRIDSSGNLLVGKTVADNTTQGIRLLGSAGFASFVRSGAEPIVINRLTSDGDLIDFRKDGTTVGSIGVSSDNLYTVATDVGLFFNSGSAQILPCGAGGGLVDGQKDLGRTSARFKDLYLSGGLRGDALKFSSNSGTERARIDSSGNLLVGTTGSVGSGPARLEIQSISGGRGINTDVDITTPANAISFNNPNGQVGYIATSGTSTSYNTSSDYRLKENVVAVTNAADRVKLLNPCRFNFIADDSVTIDGFLAHEVQEVVPEAATGTKDAMRTEEYEVSPALGEVFIPAVEGVEAVYETVVITEAVEAGFREVTPAVAYEPAYYDIDGNIIKPEVLAQDAVHEAVEAVAEVTEERLVSEAIEAVAEQIISTDVEQPTELLEGQQWRETTPQVMGEREVPEYQGIDQSKLVPLLTAALQEALAKIDDLEARVTALESV